ncbi:MAG TPA: hypothetical protein VIO56_06585 [Methylotenera sp.]
MSVTEEILKALPKDKTLAMSARELFGLCKGAIDVAQVSSLLSQMQADGTISRKEVNVGHTKYIYWNQSTQTSGAAGNVDAKPNEPIKEKLSGPATPSLVTGIKSMVESVVNSVPEVKCYPTVKIEAQIQLPDMPNTLKVIGIKPATLDDAFATGGNFTIDVATLDDVAIESFIAQWSQKFKEHAQARRSINQQQ